MTGMETDAQKVLRMEADAILELIPRVDKHFDAAVEMIILWQDQQVWAELAQERQARLLFPAWLGGEFIRQNSNAGGATVFF